MGAIKKALITGISGQDGSHLADFLIKKKYRVLGITSSPHSNHLWRLDYFGIRRQVKTFIGDVLDKKFLFQVISEYQPNELYNLAGQSSVALSWLDPVETFRINALAVLHLLEAVRCESPQTRFFQASSAEMYGNSPGKITEKTGRFQPLHPYGTSKLAAYYTVKNYREEYGLFASNGILFNHESPLRADHFVTKVIAQGVAAIALGRAKYLALGNLTAERDFTFAGDIVAAMWRIATHHTPDDFIVCSGRSVPISAFVAAAFLHIGEKHWQKFVHIDKARTRKREVRRMAGSPAKMNRVLGWKPLVTLEELAGNMVDFELARLKKKV